MSSMAQKDREIAELTEQVKRLQAIASASQVDVNAVSEYPAAEERGVILSLSRGDC